MLEPRRRSQRLKAVLAARQSSELEGGHSTAATRGDQDAYARGEITASELGERVRQRYATP